MSDGSAQAHVYLLYTKNMMCRLRKSLYGIKQAPPAWFDKFRKAILQAKFSQSPNDHSLFIGRTPRGCTILLVYVDDISINGNDDLGICELKTYPYAYICNERLGAVDIFLGIGDSTY